MCRLSSARTATIAATIPATAIPAVRTPPVTTVRLSAESRPPYWRARTTAVRSQGSSRSRMSCRCCESIAHPSSRRPGCVRKPVTPPPRSMAFKLREMNGLPSPLSTFDEHRRRRRRRSTAAACIRQAPGQRDHDVAGERAGAAVGDQDRRRRLIAAFEKAGLVPEIRLDAEHVTEQHAAHPHDTVGMANRVVGIENVVLPP